MNGGHALVFALEFRGKFEFQHRNVFALANLIPEEAQNFVSRRITRSAQNMAVAVRGLAFKHKIGSAAVQLLAPLNEFLDAFRRFVN